MPETGASGAAVLPEPIRLECGPGIDGAGRLVEDGRAGVLLRRRLVSKDGLADPGAAAARSRSISGKVVATAEVRVNGQLAGIRVAPPWRVDISKQVKPGENRIEVLVYNTLANHYLTIPTRYRGDSTSGLLGPVTIQTTERTTP